MHSSIKWIWGIGGASIAVVIALLLLFLFRSGKPAAEPSVVEHDPLASSMTGVVVQNGSYILDHAYKHMPSFAVYYGELLPDSKLDFGSYDLLVVSDRQPERARLVREQGTQLFQYIPIGSRFQDSDEFVQQIKDDMKQLQEQQVADGIFFDEVDVAYWQTTLPQAEQRQAFYKRVQQLTTYAQSVGLKTIINGTRAFHTLGDYYMWESFLSYWGTDTLYWDASTAPSQQQADGTALYGRRWNDWTLEGSVKQQLTSLVNGRKGAIETIIDLDTIAPADEQQMAYDWVYTKWLGEGGDDSTVSVWAWTGDSLPFDPETWTRLPKLWKGEPHSWNGIGQTSRYLKLRMEFDGADDLRIDRIQLSFQYKYPYPDLMTANKEADEDPFLWSGGKAQLQQLADSQQNSGRPVRILAHSYGTEADLDKQTYTYVGAILHEFHAWSYAPSTMQTIHKTTIASQPIGMLLRREERADGATGTFTGGQASISYTDHTAKLTLDPLQPVEESSASFPRPIRIDGDADDWDSSSVLYTNELAASSHVFPLFWSADSGWDNGTFDNVQVAAGDDGASRLELVSDGTGTWTSDVQGEDAFQRMKRMTHMEWDDKESGAAYEIRYRQQDSSWTDWTSAASGAQQQPALFTAFQVRVTLTGKAAHTVRSPQTDPVTKQTSIVERRLPGVGFAGAAHHWDIVLDPSIHVQQLAVTDDTDNVYIRMQTAGPLDMAAAPDASFVYRLFLDADDNPDTGYVGSWWETPFGATHRITNGQLYRWNPDHPDRKDDAGWILVPDADLAIARSEDARTIEMRVSKRALGGIAVPAIKLYGWLEETESKYGYFVPNMALDRNQHTSGEAVYTMRSGQTYTPHGFLRSAELDVHDATAVKLAWSADTPTSTQVRAWMRVKTVDAPDRWGDWQEVQHAQPLSGTITKAQYAIGLYTSDPNVTPHVTGVQLYAIKR